MKKTFSWLLCLCFALMLTVPLAQLGRADFGDYSGGSDYGDSGGSDWGSSDSGYYSDSGSYSSGGTSAGSIVLFVIVVIVVILIDIKKKKSKNIMPGGQRTDASRLTPVEQYKTLDPNFDTGAFREKLSNLYVQMQNAWTNKDIEPVRPYFTDAFWSQMDRQLDAARRANRTNYVERIAVLSVTPKGYFQFGGEDHMIAELQTRIVDYTVDDATGKVVSGSKTAEKFMTYEWELTRPTGTVTPDGDGMTAVNCPNCGAPLSINASAKCPYCGTVITLDAHDWAICAIRGIAQRTGKA